MPVRDGGEGRCGVCALSWDQWCRGVLLRAEVQHKTRSTSLGARTPVWLIGFLRLPVRPGWGLLKAELSQLDACRAQGHVTRDGEVPPPLRWHPAGPT